MKRNILFVLILALCLSVTLCACGGDETPTTDTTSSSEQSGTGTDTSNEETYSTGLEYAQEGDGYAVIGIGSCKDTEIKIPKKYRSKPVTRILPYAFAYNNDITSVVVPDTVYDVCEYAFA